MALGRRCAALGARIVGTVARQYGEIPSSCATVSSLNAAGLRSSSSFKLLWPSFNSSLVQVNNFSCCAKVDLPPPREIFVEYEEEPENNDFFIQFANEIENANPELRIVENPDDMQPRDGSFEVTSGQHLLFSKLQAKRLPRVDEILLALENLPTEALSCELETTDKAAIA